MALESLRKLACAKRDEAEDSFWALKEDPAFFQEQLKLHHEQTKVLWHKARRENACPPSHLDQVLLKNACNRVVNYACNDIIVWGAIANDLIKAEDIKTRLDGMFPRNPISVSLLSSDKLWRDGDLWEMHFANELQLKHPSANIDFLDR